MTTALIILLVVAAVATYTRRGRSALRDAERLRATGAARRRQSSTAPVMLYRSPHERARLGLPTIPAPNRRQQIPTARSGGEDGAS